MFFTRLQLNLTYTLFIIYLLSINALSEPSQVPLQSQADMNATQTFVLRHVFYHSLKAPIDQPATFLSVSESRGRNGSHHSSVSSAGNPITLRQTSTYLASGDGLPIPIPIPVPDVTDKDTIVNLAIMTSNSYYLNASESGWLNLTNGFNDSSHFGYSEDGLRGHVFANLDNSTVVVAFKGSSINPFDSTRNKDRFNDNLLFSCCCAAQRPDPYWYGEVCSCRQDVYKCESVCLTNEIMQEDRFYAIAKTVIQNVTQDLYPFAGVWTTGHSLGGSLASLMGLTFGIPAVTFEAPPERLPAQRLGLVPSESGVKKRLAPPAYHFGNTADPIFMGACNGLTSTCAIAGYAFESQCFTGKKCVYDTMGDKGWRLNVINHRINTVINDVLKAYDEVPDCSYEDEDCTDCFNWNFN